jgi:cell wall-associated NlpC family hydrolase
MNQTISVPSAHDGGRFSRRPPVHPPAWKRASAGGRVALAVCLTLLALYGCAKQTRPDGKPPAIRSKAALPSLRYTIQAGAFKNIDNAVRLTGKLLAHRLQAYHFIDESGFYKVRIGNFPSREEAAEKAENLKSARIIEDYFLIAPGDYAAAMYADAGEARLRQEILRTAERFIGVPYRWGGESTTDGFDCSGLTMVVYQLNGLELPRTSADQWRTGRPVGPNEISQGDLVFFSTRGGGRVSHVGIYIGGDTFLHAPSRGNPIQTASLSSDYYRARYVGGRSYF